MNQHTDFTEGSKSANMDLSMQARQYVLDLFNQKSDSRLVFHSYRQANEIVKSVNTLAQANGSTEGEWEEAVLAAWFFNSGFLFDYRNPAAKSMELSEKFLNSVEFSKSKKASVLKSIELVHNRESSKDAVVQMLSDAVNSVWFGTSFFENSPLWKLELEQLLDEVYDRNEWQHFLLKKLKEVKFYTAYAKVNFEPIVANHIVAVKQRIEKLARRVEPQADNSAKMFGSLEPRINSGVQTFFRTNYRTHINLSAIADQKANIMISVNAILISVIISVISYRNMTETNPEVMMPVLIFLVTGLASLIFAVLAARPKVTSIINDGTPIEEAKKNLVFFGNFVSLKVEKYEELLEEMFQNTDLLYGNLSRDLYYLGKVLDRKYRFLSISYNIFMVGFAATVLTFLGVLFS